MRLGERLRDGVGLTSRAACCAAPPCALRPSDRGAAGCARCTLAQRDAHPAAGAGAGRHVACGGALSGACSARCLLCLVGVAGGVVGASSRHPALARLTSALWCAPRSARLQAGHAMRASGGGTCHAGAAGARQTVGRRAASSSATARGLRGLRPLRVAVAAAAHRPVASVRPSRPRARRHAAPRAAPAPLSLPAPPSNAAAPRRRRRGLRPRSRAPAPPALEVPRDPAGAPPARRSGAAAWRRAVPASSARAARGRARGAVSPRRARIGV